MAEATGSEIWVERYRPRHLAEMVGQGTIVPLLQGYVRQRSLPHLLFAGPPGTGKTTAALALARDLYGDDWRENFLELNASDERGIDTVRTKVKEYARTQPLGDVGFKLLFLDEADNLTAEAQASLRRVMERYAGSCRFILSCNYSARIIDPIQSRCAVFRFRSLTDDEVLQQLERVARGERKTVTREAWRALLAAAAGDLRRATNLLQLAATGTDTVTEEGVAAHAAVPLRAEVAEMVRSARAGRFFEARRTLYRLFAERGATGEDILRAMHAYLTDEAAKEASEGDIASTVRFLGEVDFRLALGATERLQLEAVLAELLLEAERRAHGTAEVDHG